MVPGMLVEIDFSANDYRVGDIVCFFSGNKLITHRVMIISHLTKFIVKGDNKNMTEIIARKDIIGKVVKLKSVNGQEINLLSKISLIINKLLYLSSRFSMLIPYVRISKKLNRGLIKLLFYYKNPFFPIKFNKT